MQFVTDMLKTSPKPPFVSADALAECIRECFQCAQTCIACADACLGEEQLQMLRRCIRLNQDCADVCQATGSMLSRQQEADLELLRQQVQLCALACRKCAEECQKHADRHAHCRVCMEECRSCEQSCQRLLQALGSTPAATPRA